MDARRAIPALSAHAAFGPSRRGAFSLLELTIVIVIIGIVAAIAVPRFSRGSKSAEEAAQTENLRALRKAIEMYHAEHHRYPTLAAIKEQLTQYSDEAGNVSRTRAAPHLLGPYLRVFPSSKGRTTPKVSGVAEPSADWVYDEATGSIQPAKQ